MAVGEGATRPGALGARWAAPAVALELWSFLEYVHRRRDKRALLLAHRWGLPLGGGRARRGPAPGQAVQVLAAELAAQPVEQLSRVLLPLVRRHDPGLLQTIAEWDGLAGEERWARLRELVAERGLRRLLFVAAAVHGEHPRLLDALCEAYGPALEELEHAVPARPTRRAGAGGRITVGRPAPASAGASAVPAEADARQAPLERRVAEFESRLREAERALAEAREARQAAEQRAAGLQRALDQARRELDDSRAGEELLRQWLDELLREPNWPAVRRWLEQTRDELARRLAVRPEPELARRYAAVAEWLALVAPTAAPAPADAMPAPADAAPATPEGSEAVPASPDPARAAPAPPSSPAPAPGPAPAGPEAANTAARVLLIGGAREEPYRSRFEQAGFAFDWFDGDAGGEALRAAIRRADVVVLLISHASHATSGATFQCLRELGKMRACVVPRGPGVTGMLRDVRRHLSELRVAAPSAGP